MFHRFGTSCIFLLISRQMILIHNTCRLYDVCLSENPIMLLLHGSWFTIHVRICERNYKLTVIYQEKLELKNTWCRIFFFRVTNTWSVKKGVVNSVFHCLQLEWFRTNKKNYLSNPNRTSRQKNCLGFSKALLYTKIDLVSLPKYFTVLFRT